MDVVGAVGVEWAVGARGSWLFSARGFSQHDAVHSTSLLTACGCSQHVADTAANHQPVRVGLREHLEISSTSPSAVARGTPCCTLDDLASATFAVRVKVMVRAALSMAACASAEEDT